MNDFTKTIILVVLAAVVGAIAFLTAPAPPERVWFDDQGEPFYPDFTDPLEATSLEIIEYDEETGEAKPFKVEFTGGMWSIPSHYSYPADAEDRLAATAGGLIDLRKDVVQSDRLQDHEALGVLDPLDESTPVLTGRGERVVMRNQAGSVLADFIIGRTAEGKAGFRYVRLPDKKRTYAVKMDVDLTTRFADWIETNLLDLTAGDITELDINRYSIDETTGQVNREGNVRLTKNDDAEWEVANVPAGMELNQSKVRGMTYPLSRLTITGVRPKPASLTADLRTKEGIQLDLGTRLSLQSKGFFVSRDSRLLSNEGEVLIGTAQGVRYTLRFGEVLYGEGIAVSAGTDEDEERETESDAAEGTENRYLFVTASFDESLLPPKPEAPEGAAAEGDAAVAEGPPVPNGQEDTPAVGAEAAADGDDAKEADDETLEQYQQELADWEDQVEQGLQRAKELNDRFAEWYYVISAKDFEKIRPELDSLLKEKETDE